MQRKKNGSSQQALPLPAAPDRTPPTANRLHEDEDMFDGEAEAIRGNISRSLPVDGSC